MKRDVIIVGGGVVGLMNAYMLHKAGRKVTLIDAGDITDSTSFGNAGVLSAFEKYPLANPGIISKTFKLMLQGKSPIKINPTMDPKIIKWLWKFINNTSHERLKRTLALFERYGQIALDTYTSIEQEENLDFDFYKDGLVLVFTEEKSFEERIKNASDSSKYTLLSAAQTNDYLPFVKENICGSLLLKRNTHMDPTKMMLAMKEFLIKSGVEFIFNEEIIDMSFTEKKVQSIASKKASYEAETFILSTGANIALAKKAGLDLMLTPAKGYSITFTMPKALKPKTAALFNDLFIICTPRKDDVRITSKLEITPPNKDVDQKAIESILNNLREYTYDFEIKDPKLWAGLRPLTPNDMPLIGRDEQYQNLIYATGLGWLGITFAPAVAKIISELIINEWSNQQSNDILLFSGFYQG